MAILFGPLFLNQTSILENTKHRATRFISNISKLSYHERLEKLDLPT